jgi:hypothetical protein
MYVLQEEEQLDCELRSGRGPELVEHRLFEALLLKPVPGGAHERVGLRLGDEGDGATAEACACEPGTQSTDLA